MIKLTIDARMAFSSGIGTCIRQLVPYLNQPPFRVTLLVDKLNQDWCKDIELIHFSAPIYSIQEQLAFPLKIPRCDLFWSPHYNIPLLPIRARKRIVTIHDACHLALGQFLSWPERKYARFVMSRALHHSDAVITDSEFSKGELIRYLGAPQNRLHVIPVAVNHKQFSRIVDPFSRETVRKKYGLPEKFVLFVGNLKPHKNLGSLLNAFSKIESPQLGLAIVGKGKESRNSQKTADQKMVFFLGEVPNIDLPILYSLAEMLILPSFYEGFGLPPLEAMCCGCPTIVSQAASLPEVCGDASLYIDPEKPEDIRNAIANLASNPVLKTRLIQKGLERVKMFQWSQTARYYRNLFLHEVKGEKK
ncbi:MAG: Glycosyltransferase family 1 protein [Parachlamydiales bacterium]|nr:Glycosyltransferase family 1 protein [Parachlamydiales bacterium]